MFQLFKKAPSAEGTNWYVALGDDGLHVVTEKPRPEQTPTSPLVEGWMSQLVDEGFATQLGPGYLLPWDMLYAVLAHEAHCQAAALLELPAAQNASCALTSKGSLEDRDFRISIGGWAVNGDALDNPTVRGGVLHHAGGSTLLTPEQWELLQAVRSFSRRSVDERDGFSHRKAWGRIRRLAVAANARLDAFLHRSVVLTPEKLAIGLRRVRTDDDSVIEVQPTFDGAPADWLARFDKASSVQERYDIPTPDGVVQVMISAEVQTVLREIKRLDHRRVAGARAQAFIRNPYAALGEAASAVVDEEQFEQARAAAGLNYERFLPTIERDALGYPEKVGLLIESATAAGPSTAETTWFDDATLARFVHALKAALARDFQLLAWNGFDLELQGDAAEHLASLERALAERRRPQMVITQAQVYDLTQYGQRIQEVGFEKPYYSPYIAKKDDGAGWFPANILRVLTFVPEGETEMVAVPVSEESMKDLRQKVTAAKAAGKTEVVHAGLDKPIPVREAERILDRFAEAFEDAKSGTLKPEEPRPEPSGSRPSRKTLVLRPNINDVDYAEDRGAALSADGSEPIVPQALKAEFPLLPHQRQGVAWLQTLYAASKEYNCKGAVLADDMGLGKTLQLLTLMAWILESDAVAPPMLVVAPVSLLENWREEAEKFFHKGALPLLTAYGEDLAQLRVPPSGVDEQLRTQDGLSRFLKPDWLGSARIVLTTYETLRDLEFSFAMQRWSMMVCDEAQKIKNPAAMVTRAAKKQNVGFKIACTGTPVENTLADLWCLFDYVQPGLLGALNGFGRRYRRPIEAQTDEQKERVQELRKLIEPQILRRTKQEVIADLPNKTVAQDCRRLPLSDKQRELYSRAIELFKRRNDPGQNVPFKNHLGLLHYLRLICSDPRRHGLSAFKPEPLAAYRRAAPKLDWLLGKLQGIKAKGEKVIVFCEFRDIQRLLQHYITEALAFKPDIINGDTSAAASHVQSRQKRIKAFQERPGFGVIILSPVAVGFGVNIQAANHVVHYTRTWNPAKEDQATDRAYRIGQKKEVFVYYPVVHADDFVTFDVKLDTLLEAKRELAKDMLNGSGSLQPQDFDLGDVAPPETALTAENVGLEQALGMNWEYFEALATVLYAKRGFDAYRTPSSGDNGVDVVALPRGAGPGKLVQTKTSSRDNAALPWEAVKDVVAGQAHYAAQFPGQSFDLVCLTNQRFDKQAHRNAGLNSVELIEQERLDLMLQETPVSMMEVEQALFTDWAQA